MLVAIFCFARWVLAKKFLGLLAFFDAARSIITVCSLHCGYGAVRAIKNKNERTGVRLLTNFPASQSICGFQASGTKLYA